MDKCIVANASRFLVFGSLLYLASAPLVAGPNSLFPRLNLQLKSNPLDA